MRNSLFYDCLIIFLVSFFLRVCYLIFFVEPEYFFIEDQTQYIQIAKQFSDIGFLGVPAERLPGYPFFVSNNGFTFAYFCDWWVSSF